MKASEIRIGIHIIDVFNPNNPIERQIDFDDLAMLKNYKNHPLPFKPIPITEEWLLKFGFEFIEKKSYCNGKQWLLQVDGKYEGQTEINRDGTWFDGIGDYSWLPHSTKPKTMVVNTLCKGNYICTSVEYVHQLQNLYFALTNEELTLKQN